MEGSDVSFAPVLRIGEAYEHPHDIERETFVEAYGLRSLRLRRASVEHPA
jgi:alpha-methylacyl-CoA racemase